jgi:hypothetical protein
VAVLFTDHQFMAWNENLFLLSPLSLALAPLVLAAGLAGGCASGNNARWSASEPPERSRVSLLTEASERIDAGDPQAALRALSSLTSSPVPDATAHELAGKAYLGLDEYRTAHDAFVVAATNHAHPTDRRRASDLARYARGLDELSRGEIAKAREQWVEIDHPSLRRAAFEALEAPAERVAITALDGGPSAQDTERSR